MSIVVESLTCRYGSLIALQDVEAVAEQGRITAVLGPNAAGKSTLLKAILGVVVPVRGRVLVDGNKAHKTAPVVLAQRVAYVPQRSTVAARFTVREVVELGRYALPANARRVDEAVETLGLGDLADRPYAALSVGQQQRVTLARAVAQLAPDGHLVLDEPMSAMDLAHVVDVTGLLRRLARAGAAVVIVMHDLSLAAELADDVWLLQSGRLARSGVAADVMRPEHLAAVFGVGFHRVPAAGGRRELLVADLAG